MQLQLGTTIREAESKANLWEIYVIIRKQSKSNLASFGPGFLSYLLYMACTYSEDYSERYLLLEEKRFLKTERQ